MRVSKKILSSVRSVIMPVCMGLVLMAIPSIASAVICDDPNTVGGGTLGLSPGAGLGWSVGAGQCNGSFTSVANPGFTGGALELGLRAEQRSAGQVPRVGANVYEVQLGNDTTQPNVNRAWWNFKASIAYGGNINVLDTLTLAIQTISGPNLPSALSVDLKAVRVGIDDRTGQPNPTGGYADLYQISQNPEFGWFTVVGDTSTPVNGAFDYNVEGAWVLTLTATEGPSTTSTSICIHTPGATCPTPQVPAISLWSIALLGLMLVAVYRFSRAWR